MDNYNFAEFIEEVERRLKAYCEERGDLDCFSGGLMLHIEIAPDKILVNSVPDFKNQLRELISPDHPDLSFRYRIKNEASGKEILSFYYGKRTGRWTIEGPKQAIIHPGQARDLASFAPLRGRRRRRKICVAGRRAIMFTCVLIVAAGLFLTLTRVIIAFVYNPPVLDEVDGKKLMQWLIDRPQTPEAARVAGEKAARSEKLRFTISFVGVRMLILGTALQPAGTVWQLFLLTRKG